MTVEALPLAEEMVLNFGPQHPATHGTLHIILTLDGEKIVEAVPHIGYLHSGFEKLGEHLDFDQYVPVTDRMNYMSPICNNVAWTLTCEKLLGVEPPKRCRYIRVITAELSRIADHLVSLGMMALDIGAFTVFLYTFREREKLYDLFEMMCGARYTNSYTRVGGVSRDFNSKIIDAIRAFIEGFPPTLEDVYTLLAKNRIWVDRTRGVGVITPEDAISYGLSGPILRGSGIEYDVRKNEPYMNYDDFEFDVVIGSNGDVYDRFFVRVEEMRQSLRIVTQAVENLPEGPYKIDSEEKAFLPAKEEVYGSIEGLIHHFEMIMPETGWEPPVGDVYCATEAPNGELGFYIYSDGSKFPYRARTRPPSLMNFQIFPKIIRGAMVSDVVAVLASLNIIAAELDR